MWPSSRTGPTTCPPLLTVDEVNQALEVAIGYRPQGGEELIAAHGQWWKP